MGALVWNLKTRHSEWTSPKCTTLVCQSSLKNVTVFSRKCSKLRVLLTLLAPRYEVSTGAKENGQKSWFNDQISDHKMWGPEWCIWSHCCHSIYHTVKGVALALPLQSWFYQEDGMSPNLPQGEQQPSWAENNYGGRCLCEQQYCLAGYMRAAIKKNKKR